MPVTAHSSAPAAWPVLLTQLLTGRRARQPPSCLAPSSVRSRLTSKDHNSTGMAGGKDLLTYVKR
eukprot:357362-Chlamydomonas_euryale.AAC.5